MTGAACGERNRGASKATTTVWYVIVCGCIVLYCIVLRCVLLPCDCRDNGMIC